MTKKPTPLFTQHEHALEKAYEVCPECGSELAVKNSKAGAFLGCVSYPVCNYTRPVVDQEKFETQILAGTECPKCAHPLAVKQGRYGLFIGCTNFPDCHHIEDMNQVDKIDVNCPTCKTGQLQEKLSRQGKTFYSCDSYPKCKYIVNYKPIAEVCPSCDWPIMLQRKMSGEKVLICPQKKCSHKIKSLY